MNVNEFFKIVAPKLGLSENDVQTIIETGEIPEEKASVLDLAKQLMTAEGAVGDTTIRNRVLGKTLDEIDNSIFDTFRTKYADHIDPDTFAELSKGKRTSEKVVGLMDMLAGSYGNQLNSLKESGNVSQELRDQLDQLRSGLKSEKTVVQELQSKLEEQKAQFEEQRLIDRMKTYLFQKKFKSDDPDIKDFFINERIIRPALKQAKFQFNDQGAVVVKNPSDPELAMYVGSDQTNPVSFEGFLDYLGKDFYAKNDVNPQTHTKKDVRQIDTEHAKKIPDHMLAAVQKNQKSL